MPHMFCYFFISFFCPSGCHLWPSSDYIQLRDLTSMNLLPSCKGVKMVPAERRQSQLHTVLFLFTFCFEHPSGWHRFWFLRISPVLLVCAFWKQEWHSFIGWLTGAMPGQTGWGLGCHCKQSSAYSWNEITLWQWHCFAFEAGCQFWTVNPLASTSSPCCPSQLFASTNCRSVIARSKPFLPPHKETGFVINIFTLL